MISKAMLNGANATKWAVIAAAVEAAVTGLILFVRPSLFAWLVFAGEFSDSGQALARLAAFALLGLAVATWPTPPATNHATTCVRALLIYNLLATVYLLYIGIDGRLTGILLWPAVVLHAVFSALLGRAWKTMTVWVIPNGAVWPISTESSARPNVGCWG